MREELRNVRLGQLKHRARHGDVDARVTLEEVGAEVRDMSLAVEAGFDAKVAELGRLASAPPVDHEAMEDLGKTVRVRDRREWAMLAMATISCIAAVVAAIAAV